jgi:DcuC family C4-dicarboxylate transporter
MTDAATPMALLVIAVAVGAVLRGVEVRLALLGGALGLGAVAGDIRPVVGQFLATFSNEKFVVPICSAMGFAYVLRATGCDRHMVRVLVAPLRRVRFLMVPGVVVAGFLVNIPVISQASTAVCLGTVVVPLMRAAGFSPATIGAALLLGCSVGGELLNPGAPELNTVAAKAGGDPRLVVPHVAALIGPMLLISTLIFWLLTARDKSAPIAEPAGTPDAEVPERLNPLKAAVPLVPLALLFVSGPPLSLFRIDPAWVGVAAGSPVYSSRLIGLAMLLGVLVVAAVSGRAAAGSCMKSYFEGAGYGFTNIVSLIVTATCFGKGIELVGLAEHLGDLIERSPRLLNPLAGGVPFAFAWVCGSGMASTQSLYGFFYGPGVELGAEPRALGALVGVCAAAGRTMSPVAAVVFMCATLSGATGPQLVKRVAPPLLIGVACIVLLRTLGVV